MNTTTKVQRTNKRQDAIWEKAKALATANAQDERIINASAEAIGPCHLPSKREVSEKLDSNGNPSQFYDGFGWRDYPDEFRIKKLARELSLNFRREISAKATSLNVPTIKYKWQYLLEEVIADMEAFV